MGSRTGHTDDWERDEPPPLRKSIVREYAETILICVLLVIFVRAFVVQQSEIPSGSMEQTLLVGDHVLVNRFLYAPTSFDWERTILPIRPIRRGDVVVFKHPPQPEQDFIKRVIGLPGETVALRDGELWIDGLRVPQPYLTESERRGQSFGPTLVKPDHYFLLGDHRSRSSDSRVWGQASHDSIKGRAFMVLFSTGGGRPTDEPPGQVSPRSLVRKIYNVAFHLRWGRTFNLIR